MGLAACRQPSSCAAQAYRTLLSDHGLVGSMAHWALGAVTLDRWCRSLISFEGRCRFCAADAVGLAAHVLSIDDAARRCH